jgi:4-amino-4-deoxy-L-arabinose transferase-like glycosyltransferase
VRKTLLIVPAAVTLVLSIWFWQGMRASDDLIYAQAAMSLLPGQQSPPLFHQPEHHDARIGATVPLAAVFALFGASDGSLSALPLICTVLTAALVAWLACHFWGAGAGLSAGLLYAAFPLTVRLSNLYIPEPIVSFELCVACVLFLLALEREGGKASRLELLAGCIVGVAYLTTEAGALMLPAFYLYLLLGRGIRRRDAWLAAGFAMVFLGEAVYQAAVHGNPLYRFTHVASYLTDPMLADANTDLVYRLLKAIPSMFIRPGLGFGIFGPVLVVAGVYGLFRWRESALFVIWAAIILLFYNFMSVSLRHYVALPVGDRLLAPACVPLLVLSGKLLWDVWGWITRLSLKAARHTGRALFAVGAVGLLATSLATMRLNSSMGLTDAAGRNAKQVAGFLQAYPSVTFVTDRLSATAIQFYRRFSRRDTFLRFEAASRLGDQVEDDSTRPAFIVLNGPVLHEQQITGRFYGSGLLGSLDQGALPEFLPLEGATAFTAQLPRDAVLGSLLRFAPARYVLGPWRYRLAQQLFAGTPPLGDVQVFRYSQRRGRLEQRSDARREVH